jgi:uncharacterized protein (TIGR03083 family)
MSVDQTTVLQGISDELRAFAELIGSLSEEDLKTPSRCAGWTVADIAGHVVGTVVDITQGRLEGQGTAAVTQRQADERSGHSAQALSNELEGAAPVLSSLLASLPEEAWDGPAPDDSGHKLSFAVEAIWYDTYLHGDDIRDALGLASVRGAGLSCAVNHVAGYLEFRKWGSVTLELNGMERIEIGGGGSEITGDPLEFVLAATGRLNPSIIGLDATIDVYANP